MIRVASAITFHLPQVSDHMPAEQHQRPAACAALRHAGSVVNNILWLVNNHLMGLMMVYQ